MASTKDTFESATFLANTFAAGAFRGTGVDTSPPSVERLQIISAPAERYSIESADSERAQIGP